MGVVCEIGLRVFRSVKYVLCVLDCVEGLGVLHEFTDAFTEVAGLNRHVQKEPIYVPSSNDHDSFRIYL